MDNSAVSNLLRKSIDKIDALEKQIASYNSQVAIIGMWCRFPGCDDVEGYWQLLSDGAEGIVEVPKDRWDLDAYYNPDPDVPGKVYTRRAGLISGIEEFDPAFFSINPREALSMDPQQRLLLEASWGALESAGMSSGSFRSSRTGVYVGVGPNEYSSLNRSDDPAQVDAYSATGSSLSVTAGRVSYALGLEGPAIAVDTACSSSLVALHQAIAALQRGEADLALAGGVNTVLSIVSMLATSRARMLSGDGRCKTFDSLADGYVRAEGCGMVVLKRLSDAERDGDRILAVLRGSAVNQDGASAGLTVPNGPAQQRVIGEALERAGVLPHEVDYLEAHGTGTALGDPIEVRAAAAAYGAGRSAEHPLLIGSVKTNIGHLEAAAGIAGLIKAVLALQHGVIPKHLNFVTPSPRIDWAGLPVKVTAEATALPREVDRPWRIGVSSFGFSGTNAHVIVESYGPRVVAGGSVEAGAGPRRVVPVVLPGEVGVAAGAAGRRVRVLALSGKAAGALSALGVRWGQWLAARRAERGEELAALLADAAFTAGVGRSHFNHRAAIVFTGADDLAAGLAALMAADEAACAAGRVSGVVTGVRNPSAGAARIGFLFTGQGSQWAGMGEALYESEPVFRAVLERCEAVVREVCGASLLDVMFGREEAAGSLDDTQWTQPGLYALQAGLVALWASLGVKPVAVMGHSVGELAAAHAAGVLSLEDGLRLALARGALMGALPTEGPEAGSMVAVFAPAERVAAVLRDYPGVSLAAENGAHRVVSGPVAAIEAVAGVFSSEGVRWERLRTSHAFHSKLMDPMLDALARVGDGLEVSAADVPLISNVTGRLVGAGERLDGAYWRQHARSPVAFAQGVASLAGVGVDCLLEVGPHGVLSAMAALCWPAGERPRLVASLSRGEDAAVSFARAAGTVYAAGGSVAFGGLFAGEARARIALPGYPFQRQRYWLETKKARAADQNAGFLLGPAVDVVSTGQRIYPQRIGLERQPWIGDHRVYDAAVLPGMSYVAMALQAVGVPARIEGVNFIEPLFLSDDKALEREAQLVVTPAAEGKAGQFLVLSRGTEAGDAWRQHAAGEIGAGAEFASGSRQVDLAAVQAQAQVMPPDALAALWAKVELRFGPCFGALQGAWIGDGVSLVRIAAPDALAPYIGAEPIHSVLLDACVRVTADVVRLAEEAESDGVFWAPWRIDAVSLRRSVPKEFYAYCDTESLVGADGLTRSTTVLLLDADGQCFGEIAGFTVRRAPRAAFLRALQGVRPNVLYDIKWLAVANAAAQTAAAEVGAGLGAIVVMAAEPRAFGTELAGMLEASGHAVIECLTADPAGSLAQMAAGGHMANVTGLVWLAAAGQQPAPDASSATAAALLQLVQEVQRQGRPLALGLTVVTHGGVAAGPGEACDPRASALWGMGRSVQNEAPDLRLRLVDTARAQPSLLAKVIIDKTSEPQLALRANQILTPRLERTGLVQKIPDGPMRLVVGERGSLDGLRIETAVKREPGPGEVRIAVRAAGLNFRDVLNALGAYPGDPGALGGEVAGDVMDVGKGVSHLAAGDRVFGMVAGGFATDLTIPAYMLRRLPSPVSYVGGATMPVAFATAMAAFDLAALAAGDRVLIHAGAGGVGMAAIQLAKRVGAEVFVTASVSKHAVLRDLGISHVFDSRSTQFAANILTATDGLGVDVVLNSLTSEGFIAASLSCLGQDGRFVEIGKRDIWSQAEMAAHRPDVAYHILALDDLMRDTPQLVGSLLDRLVTQLDCGDLRALPCRPYPLAEAAGAMRLMAGAGHVGKIVLTMERPNLHSDASYLITGGLGALGVEAALWLAEQGARHIVLVSRRAADAATAERLRAVEAATGCRLVIQSLDLSDRSAVSSLVGRFGAPGSGWPRLAGVVHAAGVLDDGVVADQTPARLAGVWNPKALGAWNLHEATSGLDLDLFVLYSSVAATLGSPGQSNYAAANGFLDGLAALRRSQGLVATSIAWGPWSRGMADDERVRSNLLRQGLRPLDPEDAHVAMQRLLRLGTAGGVVLDADFARMGEVMGERRSPLLSGLIVSPGAGVNSDLLRRIKASKPEDQHSLIVTFLQGELQAVLGLASPPDPMTGFFDLGMDSLMALEFGTRLTNAFGNEVPLPATLAFDYPSLDKLAGYFTDNLSPDHNRATNANGHNMLAEKSLDELMSELSSRL